MVLRGLLGRVLIVGLGALTLAACSSEAPPPSGAPPAQPGQAAASPQASQAAFRELYQELVETNTTASAGSCTVAAQRMADRLTKAGYPAADVTVFVPPDHPKDGGLLATLPGTDPAAKPILLLAHIDVVEADAKDWGRDPFKLLEKDGYFSARGASDDKAMASIFVDSLIRYRAEGLQPKHPIRVALTCGEEGGNQVNGAEWLVANQRDKVDAALVLNEGADGTLDANNNRVSLDIEAGEKVYQDFILRATDLGGHSSAPVPNNAIQNLAAALGRIGAFTFPVEINDVTRTYFERQSALQPGEVGNAMKAIAANPTDAAAAATLSKDPQYNAMLRTTCVVTMINGGEAKNALPQRVEANVNCRILPSSSGPKVRDMLVAAANDPKISLEPREPYGPTAGIPPLSPGVTGPIEQVAGKLWPGVPLIPVMQVGATDATAFAGTGIPVYGLSGVFEKPNDSHIHGVGEQIQVRSLYEARDFLHELAKLYATTL